MPKNDENPRTEGKVGVQSHGGGEAATAAEAAAATPAGVKPAINSDITDLVAATERGAKATETMAQHSHALLKNAEASTKTQKWIKFATITLALAAIADIAVRIVLNRQGC